MMSPRNMRVLGALLITILLLVSCSELSDHVHAIDWIGFVFAPGALGAGLVFKLIFRLGIQSDVLYYFYVALAGVIDLALYSWLVVILWNYLRPLDKPKSFHEKAG